MLAVFFFVSLLEKGITTLRGSIQPASSSSRFIPPPNIQRDIDKSSSTSSLSYLPTVFGTSITPINYADPSTGNLDIIMKIKFRSISGRL
jgi:hypothetical protein